MRERERERERKGEKGRRSREIVKCPTTLESKIIFNRIRISQKNFVDNSDIDWFVKIVREVKSSKIKNVFSVRSERFRNCEIFASYQYDALCNNKTQLVWPQSH